MMLDLDRTLVDRLSALGVRIEVADRNTVALKSVPARADRFTKARTNLLMQRPRPGLPFIVGVDEDLEYVGPDPALARLFAMGLRQRGWRVLRIGTNAHGEFQSVVERALRILGFDGGEPVLDAGGAAERTGRETGLLTGGISLTAKVRTGESLPTVGRADRIETVVSAVVQRQSRLPVIVAEAGVGKTNLLHGVARRLAAVRPALDLIRIDLSEIFAGSLFDAEREHLLAALLKEAAAPDLVVCLERIDLVRLAIPEGPLVVNAALERGVRIIGTTLPSSLRSLWALPLTRRLQIIELGEPDATAVIEILCLLGEELARHHQVTIAESTIRAVVDRVASLDGFLPAKAIALLDAAAARAALGGAPAAELVHVYVAADDFEHASPQFDE